MLTQVDDDGTLHWRCVDCKREQTAHVSHEAVEAVGAAPGEFALPPCQCEESGGYSRMTIRVVFRDAEVAPATLHYDSLGRIVQAEIPDGSLAMPLMQRRGGLVRAISGVAWHPALLPHLAAARHLAAAGKLDPALLRSALPEHVQLHPGEETR